MTRIDLEDLPPKIARLLASARAGEEILLVEGGAVVARLVADAAAGPVAAEPEQSPDERAAEIFENFRAAIEEDF